MTLREANYCSHFLFVPLPRKARTNLSTTVGHSTQQNHSTDTNVSTDVACAIRASVPHHRMLMSVSMADAWHIDTKRSA